MAKSSTDRHWNERALTESDKSLVNNPYLSQRDLENDFLLSRLPTGARVLEVGCGNGFLTNILRRHVKHVDSFDSSENMISEAKRLYGEENNRFINDNVLAPQGLQPPYDVVVCVRVLINLRNLNEQKRAISNMAAMLSDGGRLLLVEGFLDGFEALNELRRQSGLKKMRPAAINFYSRIAELMPYIESLFSVEAEFHSGCFDFLTRVVYPAIAGESNATGYSEFHERILPIARAFNPETFKPLARVRGFDLTRHT